MVDSDYPVVPPGDDKKIYEFVSSLPVNYLIFHKVLKIAMSQVIDQSPPVILERAVANYDE
jgi:hypothetical protein